MDGDDLLQVAKSVTGIDVQRAAVEVNAQSTHARNLHKQSERTRLHQELVFDLEPVGAAENILVAELARRAAAMDESSAAVLAVGRATAAMLRQWPMSFGAAAMEEEDYVAVAARVAADRAERTNLANSRAFSRTLQQLLQLQARPKDKRLAAVLLPVDLLKSEADCQEYLVGWHRQIYVCGVCGARRGRFIPSRACLECAACRSQSGLRAGTVMADSPLPLMSWFAAIWLVVCDPKIKTSVLHRRLEISRLATVRNMANKIRAALIAADRTTLLVGLDRHFNRPESSGAEITILHPTGVPPSTKQPSSQIYSYQHFAPSEPIL